MASALIAALYTALLFAKALPAAWYVRRYPAPPAMDSMACVTVAQPILGGDPRLGAVLEASLKAVPDARFLWLVDDDDGEAQAVCARLRDAYGDRIRIMHFPAAPEGVNPKAFKLDAALRVCETKFMAVLDDDTVLPEAGLRALIAALDTCALATGLPAYRARGGIGAQLLAQFVNNNAAMTYLSALPFMEPVSINGMFYAFRPETLRRAGGYAPILNHLADDLALAALIRARGGRICQTPFAQEVETTVRGFGHYLSLMHRWYLFGTLLLAEQPPARKALIAVLHGLPPLLLWGLLLSLAIAPGPAPAASAAALLLIREAVIIAFQRRLSGRRRSNPVLSILSELLQPIHLIHALVYRTIRWRTRRYRVTDNEHFQPC